MANNQRENINNQEEYNDLLSMTTSLLGRINKSMSALQNSSDKRNKTLSNEIDMTKEILENIEDERDVEEALNKFREQSVSLSNKSLGINENLRSSYFAQLASLEGIALQHMRIVEEGERVGEIFDNIDASINNSLSSITQFVGQIPFIGDALNTALEPLTKWFGGFISERIVAMKDGFVGGFKAARRSGEDFTGTVRWGLAGMQKSLSKIAPLLATPWGLAIAAATALFALGVVGFYQLQQSAEAFRRETGLLISQTEGLADNIRTVVGDTASLGVGFEDVQNAATAFTQEFDNIGQASADVLRSMVVMNKNLGVGLETGAKVTKIFSTMAGVTDETAQYMAMTVAEAAGLAGVAPQKVMEDIAENSEAAFEFFGGSVTELAKAAIEAEKLGTSIGEITKVADNLLDFESSISKELETSALLGQRINLNRARSLAFQGETLQMQEEVLRQVEKIGGLQDLNIYQKRAIADLTGMELGSMERQLKLRQKFGNLGDDEYNTALKMVEAGTALSDISSERLKEETEMLARRQEVANIFTRLGNQMKALGIGLVNVLAPFAEAVLEPIAEAFTQMGNDFREFGSIFSSSVADGEAVIEVLKGLGRIIGWVAGVVITGLSGGMMMIVDTVEVLMDIMTALDKMWSGLWSHDGSLFVEGLNMISTAIADFLYSIGARAINAILAPLKNSKLGDWIGDSWFDLDPDGRIDDGVIQNGKVISTNPADTLIATKNPERFIENTQSSGNSNLIQEIKGLRDDLNKGKVAVYIDGKKATSAVSNVVDKIGSNSYAI